MKRIQPSKPIFWALRTKAVVASRLAHSTTNPTHRSFFFQIKNAALAALCEAEELHRLESVTCLPRVHVTIDPRLRMKGRAVFSVRTGAVALHVPEIDAPVSISRLFDRERVASAGGAR
jgi:hypothetical protein